jgi:hypothetical protein
MSRALEHERHHDTRAGLQGPYGAQRSVLERGVTTPASNRGQQRGIVGPVELVGISGEVHQPCPSLTLIAHADR